MKNIVISLFGYVYGIFKRAHINYTYSGFRKRYSLHNEFYFNGEGTLMYGEGEISIDANSYIGRFSRIQSSKGYCVKIGKNCKIGPFFQFWTQQNSVDCDFNTSIITQKYGNIIIGDGVWIGSGVVISPGIKVGDNSIIGANSMVSKDVPEFGIVGGVPAKLIRYKKIK
jgi:maltose O-acetyltransferase